MSKKEPSTNDKPDTGYPGGAVLLFIIVYIALAVTVALVENREIASETHPLPALDLPEPPAGETSQTLEVTGEGEARRRGGVAPGTP